MTTFKFAFVIDGEYAAGVSVGENSLNPEGMVAVFRSNPTIVEIPQDDPNFDRIGYGWSFDGTNWIAPVVFD